MSKRGKVKQEKLPIKSKKKFCNNTKYNSSKKSKTKEHNDVSIKLNIETKKAKKSQAKPKPNTKTKKSQAKLRHNTEPKKSKKPNKAEAKLKKQVHVENYNKKIIMKEQKVTNRKEISMEPNNETVLEMMTKNPGLNETFEYILYSNKYKHTLTDVFNIIKMLMSKLEELKKHDVDIKNIFDSIDYNYKIKGLIQSTTVNLSHVVDQLNSNESKFLRFARNFDESKIGSGDKIIENSNPIYTNKTMAPEEPAVSNTSTISIFPSSSYNYPNLMEGIKIETPSKIKTEIIPDNKNINIFDSYCTITLSSDDEYEESNYNNLPKKQRFTKKKSQPNKIDDDLESYALGSDFSDVLSDIDTSNQEIISTPMEYQDNIPKFPSYPTTPVLKAKKIKQIVSDEAINEARKSDFHLRKRLTERNCEMLKVVEQLNLKPHDIVLEFDLVKKVPLITIQKELAKVLKKHQVEGIRFLWNTVFESVSKTNSTDGTGCILAHRMGIGKTLQIITLMYTIFCYSQINIKTFLIICPPGIIYNWMDEIYKWLKDIDIGNVLKVYDLPKTNKLYNITNIATWKSQGGVLILSYENFKALVNCNQSDLRESFSHTLINPGPDVVILDEGHYIKNTNTILLKSLSQIRTKRRIVLTGTPIQNSLKEYYTMVDFVKPNILGNLSYFNKTFMKPIDSGQFIDSSDEAVEIMKQRSFILHKLLQNTVHRIDDRKLKPLFTEKVEYTIEVNMTKFQCELYEKFLHLDKTSNDRTGIFLRLHVLTLITLHPLTLYNLFHYKNNKQSEFGSLSLDDKFTKNLTWIAEYGEDSRFFEAKQSNKLTFVLRTIDECQKRNEKLLCFLKSPVALDALEYFLQKEKNWAGGKDYFRMDGKTPLDIRNQMCEAFNNPENSTKLFILSVGTGILGYNMIGANRVLLLNTSWNPSNDLQAIYRCLRFGQKKTVYVNRVLAKGTIEPKAYYRQIFKLGMASSVIDLQHMNRKVSYYQTNDLFTFDTSKNNCTLVPNTKDPVLNQLIRCNIGFISDLIEHDSMLIESVENQLTIEERRALWSAFKNNDLKIKNSNKPKIPHQFHNIEQDKSNSNTVINRYGNKKIDNNSSIPSLLQLISKPSEINNPQSSTHFNNCKPISSPTSTGKHIKFTDEITTEESNDCNIGFTKHKYNNQRNQFKNEEPIQNQFRSFQRKNFNHHKRYTGFRPHPFKGISKNKFNNEHHQYNYYENRSWYPNNNTPNDNNFHNRSGFFK